MFSTSSVYPLLKRTLPLVARVLLPAASLSCLGLSSAAANEYPLTRLGIEGINHSAYSLTLKVTNDGNGSDVIGNATWTGTVGNPPTNNAPSTNPKLYIELLPEMNYYLHAQSASSTSGQRAEVSFDVPEGHRILVDGVARNHLDQSLLSDGTKHWTLRLVRENQSALRPGEHLPPYVGEDYLLDIYLGKAKNNNDAGWIRLKKEAVIKGFYNRDMVEVRKEYSDLSVFREAFGSEKITRIQTDRLKVVFADLTTEQGFTATFFDNVGTVLAPTWTQTVKYTFKNGSTAKELVVQKEGGRQEAEIRIKVETDAAAQVTSQNGPISVKLDQGEMGPMGTPVAFEVVSSAYSLVTMGGNPVVSCPIYEIDRVAYSLGGGAQVTHNYPNVKSDSLLHYYGSEGTYNGTITVYFNQYTAYNGQCQLSSTQSTATANFTVVVDDSATWTVTQGDWKKQVVERAVARTGQTTNGLTWNVKEVVTSSGKRDEDGDGAPETGWMTDSQSTRYYEYFDYSGNASVTIPSAHYGSKRFHKLLRRIEVDEDGDSGTTGDTLLTNFDYHRDPSKPGSFGKLKSVVNPTSNWSYFTFFDGTTATEIRRRGLLKAIYRPSDDTAMPADPSASETSVHKTGIGYVSMPGREATFSNAYFSKEVASQTATDKGVLAGKSVIATTRENEDGGTTGTLSVVKKVTSSYMNASASVASTTRFYHTDEATGRAGRPYAVENADGTKTSYVYTRGTWSFDENAADPASGFAILSSGKYWRVEETNGRKNGVQHLPTVVTGLSTRGVSILDEQFRPVWTGDYAYPVGGAAGTPALVAWSSYEYDATRMHLKKVLHSNGTFAENTWSDDQLTSRVSESGEVTQYVRDLFGRAYKTVAEGADSIAAAAAGLPSTLALDSQSDITTTVVFDSLDRTVQRKTTGGGSDSLQSTQVFDNFGKLKSSTAECCSETAYDYIYGSGLQYTVTAPSGAQESRVSGLSGRLNEVFTTDPKGSSFTLELATTFVYGRESAGTLTGMPYVKEYIGPDGVTSKRWRKTVTDWLGNVLSESQSAFPDETGTARTFSVAYTYETQTNSAGRLLKVSPSGSAATHYQYDDTANGLGQLYRTIVDYGTSGIGTVEDAVDSVVETNTYFETLENDPNAVYPDGIWLRSKTLAFAPSQSAGTEVSLASQQLTGLPAEGSDGFIAIAYEVAEDASGNTASSYAYVDPDRKLAKSVSASSLSSMSQTAVSYNGLQVAASSSPVSAKLATFHYDSLRRLAKATDPDGDAMLRGYESNSTRLEYEIVEGKSKIVYEYNLSSAAQGAKRQLAKTSRYTYNGGEPLPDATLPASYTTTDSSVSYSYHPNGSVMSTSGSGVTPSYYTYDAWGQLTSVVQSSSQGGSSTPGAYYDYDEASGLVRGVYRSFNDTPLDGSPGRLGKNGELYEYNANGSIRASTNARGQETSYTYTSQGQVASMTALEGSFTYSYDRLGRVTSQTEPVTGTRNYSYRSHDATVAPLELETVDYTDAYYGTALRKLEPLYDANGRSVGVQALNSSDAVVYKSEGGLDGLGRVSSLTAKSGSMSDRVFNFSYDATLPHALSQIGTSLTSGGALTHFKRQFARDGYGRLRASATGVVASAGGNLLNTTDGKIASGATPHAHYYYTRDKLDRISVEEKRGTAFDAYEHSVSGTAYQGLQTAFAYNAKGEVLSAHTGYLQQATYGSGYLAGTILPGRSLNYETDAYGNLQRRRVAQTSTPSAVATSDSGRHWTHNEYNQISQQTDIGKLPVTGTASTSASVWALGSEEASPGATGRLGSYFHRSIPYANQAGPVFEQEVGIVAQTGSGASYVATYDFRSAMIPPREVDPLYDEDGNLLHDGTWRYEWDSLGRLARVQRSMSAVLAGAHFQRHAYAYDEMGRRVETLAEAGSSAGRTRYAYWGMNMIAEIKVTVDGSDNVTASTIEKAHFWRPGAVGHADSLLGTAVDPSAAQAADRKFVLVGNDGRGNVTTWTDGATGTLLGSRDYGPYGELWHESWEEGWAEDAFGATGFGFSTEYHDETGLVYYGFRYYSPSLGRFISRDPMGESAGPNLYRLAGGDPVNKRDLWGLCEQDPISGQWGSGTFTYVNGSLTFRGSRSDLDSFAAALANATGTGWQATDSNGDLAGRYMPGWGDDPSVFNLPAFTVQADYSSPGYQGWMAANNGSGQSAATPTVSNSGTVGGPGGSRPSSTNSTPDTPSDKDPKDKTEEKPKIPCSQLRRDTLGSFFNNNNNVEGFGKGALSWFGAWGRALDVSYSGYGPVALISPERGRAVRAADGTLIEMASLYYSDEAFQQRANEIISIFGENNIGTFAGRTTAGVTTMTALNIGMKKAGSKGAPIWFSLATVPLLARADFNQLIRNDVDPNLALVAAFTGNSDPQTMREISRVLSDDKELQRVTGIPCEEGK